MSSPEQLRSYLESGLRAHNQGDLDPAMAAYRHVLALAPDHPDALRLLGTALLQTGDVSQAVDFLQRASRMQRNDPAAVGNLAQAYFAAGRYEEAREAFRKASRLDPREMQFPLGVANALAMLGVLDEAESLLQRLSTRFPQAELVWFNLGNVLRDRGRPQDALEPYRKAMQLDPHLVDARNNLAVALHALQRFEEAEQEFRACLDMAPDHVLARCNLASVLIDLGRFSEAEILCREVIAHAPDMGPAHTFLGAALGHQGRLLDALASHGMAAELAPHDAKVQQTYASALIECGNFGEGLRRFRHALALDPALNAAHQMLCSSLLAAGCLMDGWSEYGHRPAYEALRVAHPDSELSRTLPGDLRGKRIFVSREQGLGDEIFFLRYLQQLGSAGARIAYRASGKIRSLLGRALEVEQFMEEKAPLPKKTDADFDAVILVGDQPHALGTCANSPLPVRQANAGNIILHNFPWRISVYWPPIPPALALRPLDARVAELRARLAQAGPPPYLGLTWRAGTPPSEQSGAAWALHKEIRMDRLAAALRYCPGTFIALQRKPAPGEIESLSAALGRQAHDFTDLNEDLEGMLALLALIDEYIGVSNTNTHLRAGVGKTARVLVPCPADWRWMHAGRHSPWFPQFPIYRQSLQGDWNAALARLASDLEADLQARATAQDRS